jgi:hypothetical protein
LHPQLLLTQHLLARAALELRRRSDFRQTGHSNEQKRVESKLHFRCTQRELERCGLSHLLLTRLSLTQNRFAGAACSPLRCNQSHQSGH